MRQNISNQTFHDSSAFYQNDDRIISYKNSDYFSFSHIRNIKDDYLPQTFISRKAYCLNYLGDIQNSYLSLFYEVVHHEENFNYPSQILLSYLTKVYRLLREQNLAINQIKSQMFGKWKDEQEIQLIFQKCMKVNEKKKSKNFDEEIKLFSSEKSIEAYIMKSKQFSKQRKREYEKFITRNLDYLVIKSKKFKKQLLVENVERIRPLFNFTLLQDKKQEKFILLENSTDDMQHFEYQKHEPLVLRKYIQPEDNTVMSLEDLVFSLQIIKKYGKETDLLQNIKKQLLEKLCKHISLELYLFEKYSGFEYPELNPMTVLFNIEKEFFFLSSEPVIIRHLLGYKNRPTTKANFFQGERFKRIERASKLSETDDQSEQDIIEKPFHRLMKLISNLEKLQMKKSISQKESQIFKERLNDVSSWKQLFGDFVFEKLQQVSAKIEKNEKQMPNLKQFVEVLYAELTEKNKETMEVSIYRNWLRVRSLKILLKDSIEQEKKKSQNENQKKILSLKIVLYACLFVLAKKSELQFQIDGKRKAYEEYVKELKKLNLEKNMERAKKFCLPEEEVNRCFDEFKSRLEMFIKMEVYSEKNEKVMKNYETLSNEDLRISLQNPEQNFIDFYENGESFFSQKLFSKREQILYQLVGRICPKKIEWAVLNVYLKLKDSKHLKEDELEEIYVRLNQTQKRVEMQS